MKIQDLHHTGRLAIKLYAANNDPLTASAAEILLQVRKLPLTAPQKSALMLVDRQVQAYACLHPEPLM